MSILSWVYADFQVSIIAIRTLVLRGISPESISGRKNSRRSRNSRLSTTWILYLDYQLWYRDGIDHQALTWSLAAIKRTKWWTSASEENGTRWIALASAAFANFRCSTAYGSWLSQPSVVTCCRYSTIWTASRWPRRELLDVFWEKPFWGIFCLLEIRI